MRNKSGQHVKLTNPECCIAMDIDLSPKIVMIYEYSSSNVAVKAAKNPRTDPLWIPRSIVFEFDSDFLDQIGKAVSENDGWKLKQVWESGKKWNPSKLEGAA